MVPSIFLYLFSRCLLCLVFCSTFLRLQLFQSSLFFQAVDLPSFMQGSAFSSFFVVMDKEPTELGFRLSCLVAHWNFCITSGWWVAHWKTWGSLSSAISLDCSGNINHHLGLSNTFYYSSDVLDQTTVQWPTKRGAIRCPCQSIPEWM